MTYSLQDTNSVAYAKNIITQNGSYIFDVVIKNEVLKNIVLNMGGLHNIENAIAAISIAKKLKLQNEVIREAVEHSRE